MWPNPRRCAACVERSQAAETKKIAARKVAWPHVKSLPSGTAWALAAAGFAAVFKPLSSPNLPPGGTRRRGRGVGWAGVEGAEGREGLQGAPASQLPSLARIWVAAAWDEYTYLKV